MTDKEEKEWIEQFRRDFIENSRRLIKERKNGCRGGSPAGDSGSRVRICLDKGSIGSREVFLTEKGIDNE